MKKIISKICSVVKSSMLRDLPLSTTGEDGTKDSGGMEGSLRGEFEGRLRGPPLFGGDLEGSLGEEAEGCGGCRGCEDQEQEGGGQEEGGHAATAPETASSTAFM